ncbi:hypothetical protein Cob_v004736 [Colletotrichum orbiculare MAFF 240422]|uniref:Uncharacterized protein n=1 Tax=Colletotrichum orbiculare (strain 104-T / ATCC 96160 / CBS 514.97 / LARS 414 / MAFF 240422) TaxID=1213857 RepID=A0A484FW51_COLOR|nr:hypothetical protein Cob_v004736 [Colletotrichum orbiculare MAFF 240422]
MVSHASSNTQTSALDRETSCQTMRHVYIIGWHDVLDFTTKCANALRRHVILVAQERDGLMLGVKTLAEQMAPA